MFITRKTSVEDIPHPKDRSFFEELTTALGEDRGHKDFPIDISYHYKSTAGWTSKPDEYWVVRPVYNLRDATQRDLLNSRGRLVYSAGDGNITAPNPIFRVFQLFGLPKTYPDNTGYIWHHEDDYFQEGSKARDFMNSQGLEWLFRFSLSLRKA